MKVLILIVVIFVQISQAVKVRSCPQVSCNEKDVATDSDDWCLRVNYFDSRASESIV